MQFWQYSISLQFLQIITANDFAFGSLQNLQLLTSADCSVSLHAMVHCNSKCIAVIPLQFHCNFPAIVCSEHLLFSRKYSWFDFLLGNESLLRFTRFLFLNKIVNFLVTNLTANFSLVSVHSLLRFFFLN